MAGLWYRVGTVTLTNGSKAVVGYGTKWKSANPLPGKGSMLCGPDGKVYEVDTVADDNNLTLVSNYTGTSGAGQGYALVLMALTIPQFSTQLSQFVQKNSLFASQINTLLTATGDVNLTDPDSGLVIKAPSWSKIASEGEGQAARAKVEADRAKTEADRSGTEADRAAGIVAAAALPLPDVWAPLSDSLRLITGYGRDVLVGSDVVARMLNYSRSTTKTYWGKDGQLKVAAVNEPAFEKDGLLVEGQSTNYIVRSEGLTQLAPEPDSVVVVENGVTLVKYVGTGALAKDCTVPANTVLTLSFFVKLGATDTVITFQTRDGSFTGRTAIFRVKPTGELVVTNSQSLFSSWSVVKVSPTLVRVIGTTISSDSTIYRTYRGDPVANETFGSFQLEALPFASSYIPTAGAAVTRAKDILYLAPSGNVPSDINMAFAAQIKLMGKGLNSWPRVFEISDPANKGSFVDMTTGMWGGVNLVGVRKTVAARFSDTSRWLDGVNLGSAWQPYPVKTYSDPVYIAGSNVTGSRDFYGHVRNVRAWFFSPTDDQMKAIR